MEDLKEIKISGEIVYDGKLLEVHKDKVLCPNNHESYREYINKCKAAVVIAKVNDKFIMEKQFRYPYNDIIIEFPAGKCEENEDSKVTASRELEEETGYTASTLKYLGSTYPSPAYTNEIIDIYLGKDLVKGKRHLDENEFVDLIYLTEEEVKEYIKKGMIKDSKTVHGFLLYLMDKEND